MNRWFALKVLGTVFSLGASLLAHGAETEKANAEPTPTRREIRLTVSEKGFEPASVHVKKGQPLRILLTRTTDETCATEIVLPQYGIEKKLPLGKTVRVDLTPDKEGEVKYGCAMGMFGGVLLVD